MSVTTVTRQLSWIEYALFGVTVLLGVGFVSLQHGYWQIGYPALFGATIITLYTMFKPL